MQDQFRIYDCIFRADQTSREMICRLMGVIVYDSLDRAWVAAEETAKLLNIALNGRNAYGTLVIVDQSDGSTAGAVPFNLPE